MYLLDIYMLKGTLLVFIDFVEKFLRELHAYCSHITSSSTTSPSKNGPPMQERPSRSSKFNIMVI